MKPRCTNQKLLILFFLIGFLSACSHKNVIVLLPDKDGTTGAVTVSNSAGSVEIDQPSQAITVSGKEKPPEAPIYMKEDDINSMFSEVLKIRLKPPVHFMLYFQKGTTTPNPDSMKNIPAVIDAIKRRQSRFVSVIGHSDTAGNKEYNLKLSTRRAVAISHMLVERGIAKEILEITSHGEENPLVPTGDNVDEPKNRRVEIIVR